MDKNGQDKCLDVWKPKTGLSQVYPTAEFKDKHLRSHATRISPVFPHSIPIKWLVQISIKSYWQFFLLQFWKSIPFERDPQFNLHRVLGSAKTAKTAHVKKLRTAT